MTIDAIAYRPPWRALAALLVVSTWSGALVLGALVLVVDAWLGGPLRLDNPLRLLRAFTLLCILPAVAGWLLRRAFAVRCRVASTMLVLERPGQRIEIPFDAIAAIEPWRLPLPGPGLALRLRSGRRFSAALQVADPAALIEALVAAGADGVARAAADHPTAQYARTRAAWPRTWGGLLLAFPIFALLPTVPIFRLHQWIAYGGTFGEYYRFGLQAYALAFAIYWATFTVYLVLYAAALRVIGEALVLASAYAIPARRAAVRRAVEATRRVLYFGAVPLLLLRLYLLS